MSKPPQKLVRFDWAMKNILRDKANFDVLEGFLTCLLKEKIVIENLLESESNKDYIDQKSNRVDLKCKDSTGRQVIIEVQSQRQVDYFQRIAWGASKALVESLKSGDGYFNVAKVISVSILFHELFNTESNDDYLYYGQTDIRGCHNHKPLLARDGVTEKSITSGSVMPEYYIICVNNFEDKIREQIDEWVYIFKNEEVQEGFHSPGIVAAKQKLDYLGMSRAERTRYDAYKFAAEDMARDFYTARGDGKREGRAEGLAEGLAEGEAIGIKRVQTEMVLNMINAGIAVNKIAEIAKLSATEIRAIQNR